MRAFLEKYKFWVEMAGGISALFICFSIATEVNAFEPRISKLEVAIQRLITVDEKLDLVITLLKDRRR